MRYLSNSSSITLFSAAQDRLGGIAISDSENCKDDDARGLPRWGGDGGVEERVTNS